MLEDFQIIFRYQKIEKMSETKCKIVTIWHCGDYKYAIMTARNSITLLMRTM